MSKYLLSKHVYLCISGPHLVLADLRRDDYTCLDFVDASPVAKLVPGWPIESVDAANQPLSEDEPAFVELINSNILTTDPQLGKYATPVQLEPPTEEILEPRSVFDDLSQPRYPVTLRHRINFYRAVHKARRLRKSLPLEQLVGDADRRRASATRQITSPESKGKIQHLISSFRWLRPWGGYVAENNCLFDSLVLIEYLALFDIYPQWVYGVKTAPLGAHSWVQDGPVLLNDHLKEVNQFAPIVVA